MYTTNTTRRVNTRLRKILETRRHFPCDEAASKPIWPALLDITADWSRADRD
ncbi:hypothetical protein GV368_05530 [Tepidiphilus sp. B18-69]|uniref:Transposase n=1 Tax=Tepidiphilus baoligensis TaxID=2698687 RepID=A0ABX1QLJ4_9PROT|nr:hypothetical protein [Tepidiphilus baoligensis]